MTEVSQDVSYDMDDDAPQSAGPRPEPSPEIQALDEEIKNRFSRRTGSIEKFLGEWIKLDESQDMLFGAVGLNGENYFQYILACDDMEMGLALARMCEFFAESTSADKVVEFLEKRDNKGNDIWHYLASALARSETENSLQIAKLLINLEIDYIRKNDEDETALSKLLLPEVKWKSINSMNAAKELTIDDLEAAFSEQINRNEELKQEIMCSIFLSDLAENDGQLTQSIIAQGMRAHAENELRAKTMSLMFDYVGGTRRETVFMKIAESDIPNVFENCIELLMFTAEDRTKEVAARDINLARAHQQVFLYKRLTRKNRGFQTALSKAIIANNPRNVATICGMLKNEKLVVTSKDSQGRTQHEELIVDEKSPAPQNPSLSMLLQQDVRGNTPFHTATLLSRTDCLKRLFNGLSLMDSFMIVTRIPNRYGITAQDMLDPKTVMNKLVGELKRGKIKKEDANQMANMAKQVQVDIREFLGDMIARAQETFERTGGLSEAKPTFDLKRVPTVAMQLREMMKARAAGGGR